MCRPHLDIGPQFGPVLSGLEPDLAPELVDTPERLPAREPLEGLDAEGVLVQS